MPTRTIPKFLGTIEITATNNTVTFFDSISGAHSASIPDGTYQVEDAMNLLATNMSAVASQTYTASINNETGQVTITATGNWELRNQTIYSNKILTGGDVAVGETGPNHFGFQVEAAAPGLALSFTGQVQHSNAWYPSEPPRTDNERLRPSVVVEGIALDGTSEVYDFTGDSPNRELRTLTFDLLLQDDRDRWFDEFWIPYAKSGASFRFYVDRTQSSYVDYRLTGPSLSDSNFQQRRRSYPYWGGTVSMHKG